MKRRITLSSVSTFLRDYRYCGLVKYIGKREGGRGGEKGRGERGREREY
jgi:hypothetical protein